MSLEKLLHSEKDYTREEIIYLLSLEDETEIELLYARARKLTDKHFGDKVYLRGIIEFSNYCSQHCLYCGLREDNLIVPRYRMTAEEILEAAKIVYNTGIKTIVLQSGEDSFYDTDLVSYLIYSIKQQFDVAITLCLGQRNFEEYKIWKIAGADRYLLKHESANPKLYSVYHRKAKLEERIQHLQYLKRIGFQLGSGNMVGLPLQTVEDIADDILLCRDLDVDMAAFGPFVPAPNTPYQNKIAGNFIMSLKTIAVARLVLKTSLIPAATSLDSVDPSGREKGLAAGANVIMPNFTPQPYREKYQIYGNRIIVDDEESSTHLSIKNRIEAAGRKVAYSKGHSIKVKATA